MKHETTGRATSFDVTGNVNTDVVTAIVTHEGCHPEEFTMTGQEATELAESLLKAAGVEFKLTLNA